MYSVKLHKLTLMQLGLFSMGGMFLGLLYISLEHGFEKIFPFINGSIAGLLIGLVIGFLEIYLLKPHSQQNSFLTLLFFRVTVYMLCIASIILIVVTLNRSVRYDQTFSEAFTSEESQTYLMGGKFKVAVLFTFIASVVANFTRLISFKIGRGNLTNFILGVYHRPRLVNRAFLLIQINNSHQLLKNASVELYHDFLNKIYKEISMMAMKNNGYVYEYVDNQTIVYWNTDTPTWRPSLFTCYKEIILSMKQNELSFKKKYNLTPELMCIAHGGEVVQAEIGELKTEIVYHGDVLNTAGRIMNVAVEKKIAFIISEYVFDKTEKTKFGSIDSIGQIELRGKQKPITLFSIS